MKLSMIGVVALLVIGCGTETPVDESSSALSGAPDNGTGHWILLRGDSSKSASALKTEIDDIFATASFADNKYWQGVQLRVNWVDVQPAANAALTTAILDGVFQDVASDNARYHTAKKVNLQIQYKSFGATNTAVPANVDAFEMNNPGWIVELWKTRDVGFFTGFIDKLATWYDGSTNAKALLAGIVFPETACGGCAAASGYSGPLFEAGIEGYLKEVRAKFPSTIVVDQLTNFFVTASGDPHPSDDRWYLYDLATWGCSHHVGVGGPDAPEYNVNKSTCGNKVGWSDPGSDVITGNGKAAAYAMNLYVHVQFSEQNADYEIPNTADGDYSMIVDTLGTTQAVWLNEDSITGTCSNGGNSFDIASVYQRAAAFTSAPSWSCSTIPSNPW